MDLNVWAKDLAGYKLLDSGNKKKLEEINGIRLVRSEPRAWWKPKSTNWQADALFESEKKGSWEFKKSLPGTFDFKIGELTVKLKFPATSKHIGIFPEQVSQWDFIEEKIGSVGRPVKILNLFGYTGVASLVAAKAGAEVTHVDGSRAIIGWARENQEASGLQNAKIRWILDDAVDFVRREVKRGNKYDAIVMDPPSFGRGPKGQVWKVEEDLAPFLAECRKILGNKPLFFILNMYSTELSPITLKNLLLDLFGNSGEVQAGELAIKEVGQAGDLSKARLLPLSIFANWSSK